MTDQIHRIADKEPVFPCWLWDSYCNKWLKAEPKQPRGFTLHFHYTHWSPCSPTAPEVRPEEAVFHNEVMGEFIGYFPKNGEICEYEITPGNWVGCEIIEDEFKEPRRYLARYASHTGQIKQGLVLASNLRAKVSPASTPSPAALAAAREIHPTRSANHHRVLNTASIIHKHYTQGHPQ